MRVTNESSLREISQTLNISEGAVKARLYRARLQLSAVCGAV
jgi:DNA-directed RNA polymerase specialized sigma24 family protein